MATISFTTTFDLISTTKQFVFTDTSDYIGQGIALADVTGSFKITSPSGIVIYNNTDYSSGGCDIDCVSSLTNQTTITLPVDSSGIVEAGIYSIVYTVYNSDTAEYYTITNTYTFNYSSPTVSITQTVNCTTPSFVSVDATDYVVAGITPTIVRVHTLNYPYSYGSTPVASPITSSGVTISTGIFYNGTQTSGIASTLTYVFSDGLVISDYVTGEKEIVVDCTSLCAIYCCLRSCYNTMVALKTTNDYEYNKQRLLFAQAMAIRELAEMAQDCGKYDDVSGYLAQVKTLLNCTDDCSCTGDSPTQVTGIGSQISLTPQTLSYSWATDSAPGIAYSNEVLTTAYVMAESIFEGTNYHGADVASYDISYSFQTGTVDFEVYDFNNSTILASYTLTPSSGAIKRLTIVNVAPTSRTRLKFQIKNKALGVKFSLYSASINF